VLWNCSAFVQMQDGVLTPSGNVTEVGMVNFLLESNVEVEKMIEAKKGNIVMEIPFDSKRKR
jgi:magnesium-transporting ATPase (P-type)